MTLSRQTGFVPIGDVVAQHVVPRLHRAQRLPLHVSCIGTASHDGCDETDGLDRIVVIGECPSPEEA